MTASMMRAARMIAMNLPYPALLYFKSECQKCLNKTHNKTLAQPGPANPF